MSLPLQPTGQPWSPGLRRAALVLLLAAAVLLLGVLAPARGRPPQLILGGPGCELDYVREARRLIDGAQRRVWLSMYVLRPDDGVIGSLLDGLAAAAARGVEVRVALDRGAGWDGQPDAKHEDPAAWLAAHGVRAVLDEEDVTSHAKVLVVDSRFVLAGSHNWTRSAVTRNRELSWLIDDAGSAVAIERWLGGIPGW
jgi:phosphatidylserine/phosphatidylglycerophosphate/cardiolipin synthase-like enzyme